MVLVLLVLSSMALMLGGMGTSLLDVASMTSATMERTAVMNDIDLAVMVVEVRLRNGTQVLAKTDMCIFAGEFSAPPCRSEQVRVALVVAGQQLEIFASMPSIRFPSKVFFRRDQLSCNVNDVWPLCLSGNDEGLHRRSRSGVLSLP